jgi:4'-phosphopantetheinyl transferase
MSSCVTHYCLNSQKSCLNAVPSWIYDVYPSRRFIRNDELHLWLVRLDEVDTQSMGYGLLSSSELAKAESFKFAIDRFRYVSAHIGLRKILSRYVAVSPSSIEFLLNDYGKPRIKNNAADVCFNLSHSGIWTLIGITRGREIGVDIEVHRNDIDCFGIARRFFSTLEIQRLESATTPHVVFFDSWVRKEAYIKAVGKGLSYPLNSFSVPFGENETWPVLISDEEGRSWQWWGLNPQNDCSAAVVVHGSGIDRVHFRRWKSRLVHLDVRRGSRQEMNEHRGEVCDQIKYW